MDSLQVVEFNEAFMFAFPEFVKPLIAITCLGIVIYITKRMLRIN